MLKSFQKRVSARKTKLIKGLCLSITILFISLCITPFQIYAAEQTQIVPTWNWGSQYANQFTVTNFCEGSGTSVSCELRFTANNSYYGYLSFDGYNGNTKWIDYKNVWIADGYGAYRYSLYQNGVIQINKINIEGGFLKSSMDNLDLQDIIDLLTAIETDTTSIDNQLNTELQRIQSIINNQITQNGYLEIISKLRQWNIPIESFGFCYRFFLLGKDPVDLIPYNSNYLPIFKIDQYEWIYQGYRSPNFGMQFILWINKNLSNLSDFQNTFNIKGEVKNYTRIDNARLLMPPEGNMQYSIIKFELWHQDADNIVGFQLKTNEDIRIIPIYLHALENDYNISTDFALQFGLTNQLLDDIHTIAQGTTESNSAATGLDSETSSFESVASGLYTSENSFNQNMNSSLQSIDTSFNPSTSFGSKFLYSADWVRSQFNTITSNTPFGSVLSFSMLLGLSLLIIGKAFK